MGSAKVFATSSSNLDTSPADTPPQDDSPSLSPLGSPALTPLTPPGFTGRCRELDNPAFADPAEGNRDFMDMIGLHKRKESIHEFLLANKYAVVVVAVLSLHTVLSSIIPLLMHKHVPVVFDNTPYPLPPPLAVPDYRNCRFHNVTMQNAYHFGNTPPQTSPLPRVFSHPYIFSSSSPESTISAVDAVLNVIKIEHFTQAMPGNAMKNRHTRASGMIYAVPDPNLCFERLRAVLQYAFNPACDASCNALPSCEASCKALSWPCGSLLNYFKWNDEVDYFVPAFAENSFEDGGEVDVIVDISAAYNVPATGSLDELYRAAIEEYSMSPEALPVVASVMEQVFNGKCKFEGTNTRMEEVCSGEDYDQLGNQTWVQDQSPQLCTWEGFNSARRRSVERDEVVEDILEKNAELLVQGNETILDSYERESLEVQQMLRWSMTFQSYFVLAVAFVSFCANLMVALRDHSDSEDLKNKIVPEVKQTVVYQQALIERTEALTRENAWQISFEEAEDLRDSLTFVFLIRKLGVLSFFVAIFVPLLAYYYMWEIVKRESTTTAGVTLSVVISVVVFIICGNMFLEITTDAQRFLLSVIGYDEHGKSLREKALKVRKPSRHPNRGESDESQTLLLFRALKICFKHTIFPLFQWLFELNAKRKKHFLISEGGGYTLMFMISCELPEIFFQFKALDELLRVTSFNPYTYVYAVTIALNCVVTPVLFYYHEVIPIEAISLVDICFDCCYAFFNIFLRLGSAAPIDAMATFYALAGTILAADKLGQVPRTAMRRRVIRRILDYVTVLETMFSEDMDYDDSDDEVLDENGKIDPDMDVKFKYPTDVQMTNLTVAVLRTKRIPNDTGEMNQWKRTSAHAHVKVVPFVIKFMSIMMCISGVSIMSLVFVKVNYQQSVCAEAFGDCVWAGVEPKIYFADGLFEATTCSEGKIRSIDASGCSLSVLPTELIMKCTSLQFLDVSNVDNLIDVDPRIVGLPTLVDLRVTNTPFAKAVHWNDRGLTNVPTGIYDVVKDTCEVFDLAGNELESLDFEELQMFRSLDSLDVSRNNLRHLEGVGALSTFTGPDGEWHRLSLNASHNMLDNGALMSLVNFEDRGTDRSSFRTNRRSLGGTLDLTDNIITEIGVPFASLYRDDDVRIVDNPVAEIVWDPMICRRFLGGALPKWIEMLNNVKRMVVSNCYVEKVPLLPRNVEIVDLSFNELRALDSAQVVPNLVKLDVSHNALKEVSTASMDGMVGLEELKMTGNYFTALDSGALASLTQLRFLDLEDNQLVSAGDLSTLGGLQTLYLRNNKMKTESLVGLFDVMARLTTLDLGFNDLIGPLPAVFDSLVGLEYFGVADNALTAVLPGAFDKIVKLREVSFSHNYIVEFPESLFDNAKETLEAIDISQNRLVRVPLSLREGTFPHLLFISASVNSITDMPDFAGGDFPSLFWLGLSFNRITEIAVNSFDPMPNLERLGLGSNRIAELPLGVFDKLLELKSCWLYSNEVKVLEKGLFANSRKLRDVNFRQNVIEEVGDGLFSGMEFLDTVWLSGNNIEKMGEGVFDDTPVLRSLSGMRCADFLGEDWESSSEKVAKCEQACTQDCSGMCLNTDQVQGVGNGVCNAFDDFNLDCSTWDFDGEDCVLTSTSCALYDCNGSCLRNVDCFGDCSFIFAIITGDGYCDDGGIHPFLQSTGPNLYCAEWNWDGGDCDHQDYVYCADFENLDYGEGSREDNPPGYAGLIDPSARRLDDAEVGEGGRWVLRGGNCDAHGQWFDENPNNSA